MTDPLAGAATNRRNFLGLIGLGAAAAAGGGLLAGCGDDTGGSGGQGKAAAVDKLSGLVPTYAQLKIVQPDLPGTWPGVDPAFLKYPAQLVRAVNDTPITSGKQITAMTPLWGPVPPTSNSYFDAVNARLGGPVKFNILDGNTYDQKLSAILAAGDVPEMIQIPGWNINTLAHFSDAVNKNFADLTPYLQGDKAKDYPLLANVPTDAWKFAVWNDKLHAIPLPNTAYVLLWLYRSDLLQQMGVTVQPQSADDLWTLAKQITDPKANKWAFAGQVHMEMARAFGAPRRWRKKSDGTLEFRYETEEYAAAIEWTARAFKEGLVHPTVVENKNADTKQLLASGQALMSVEGLGSWHEQLQQQIGSNPDFRLSPIKPFPAKAGGTNLVWRGEPAGMYVFIKQGLGDERTKELLRVANWCSAPFGTEEFELQTYGVRDKHFTLAGSGPQFTSLGNKEAAAPTYYFLGGHVPEITQSGLPGYVQAVYDWETEASKYLEKDPFAAIRVEDPSNFAAIQTPTEDKVNDILRGKRPVSDLKQVVQEFKAGGGDEGRAFYQKVLEENS